MKTQISLFYTNLRVHWKNWRNRGTARAYKKLTTAMRNDPSYAHSWRCNIALPIYVEAKGKLTIHEADVLADRLMKHLFDVGFDTRKPFVTTPSRCQS